MGETQSLEIAITNSPGVDIGGIMRSFITNLFEDLCKEPNAFMEKVNEQWILKIDSKSKGMPIEEQIKSCRAIGTIFAHAFQNSARFLFHSTLYIFRTGCLCIFALGGVYFQRKGLGNPFL